MRVAELFAVSLMGSSVIACAADPATSPDGNTPTVAAPNVTRCANPPDAGPTADWRHTASSLTVQAGEPNHRGTDLIATPDDATQVIAGKIAYGGIDKDLVDEDVDVFACTSADTWRAIGHTRTDDNGMFSVSLTGSQLLPEGMRDLYVSVAGDRTGAYFVGLVAQAGIPIVASDVDGTLTASENAYPESLALHTQVAAQPEAAARLTHAMQNGATIVYVTTRSDKFTQDTRSWLAANGFPYGIMRMPSALFTLPGQDTVEAKTTLLHDVARFDLRAGVGNRHTDVEAYNNAGIDAAHIFIKLPEFQSEVQNDLDAKRAIGVPDYLGMPM